jgi:2'-5' RNA ligase
MRRVRTFIAVDTGETIRDHAVELQRKLGRNATSIKWVVPENLHLTLLFLGEVDELEVLQICKAIAAKCKDIPPFTMAIEGLGAFPNNRHPKILWAGVKEGVEELKILHDALEAPLLDMGAYRREDRAYTPHLTLGRLAQEDRGQSWAQTISAHATWQAGDTVVREVLVMSSELQRDGPVYTVLGRAKLGGGVSASH